VKAGTAMAAPQTKGTSFECGRKSVNTRAPKNVAVAAVWVCPLLKRFLHIFSQLRIHRNDGLVVCIKIGIECERPSPADDAGCHGNNPRLIETDSRYRDDNLRCMTLTLLSAKAIKRRSHSSVQQHITWNKEFIIILVNSTDIE
jgi:hypothetical protein